MVESDGLCGQNNPSHNIAFFEKKITFNFWGRAY